jgi:hypothetical protein
MKGLARELLHAWAFLIVLFLVLVHFTGFERDIRAIGRGAIGFTEALQGRSTPRGL